MKKWSICILTLLLFIACFSPATFAQEAQLPRVIDEAGMLSDQEKIALSETISHIAEAYSFDVVILTVNSLNGQTVWAYADDYFDYNGYGYGADRDGVLFLVSMEERDWTISTRGYGETAFTDYGLEKIEDKVVPYLSQGNYYGAFKKFLNTSQHYLKRAVKGKPVDVPGRNRAPSIVIAIVSGLIYAWIITSKEKSAARSAIPRSGARNYLLENSFALTEQKDVFLYGETTRVKRPEPSESSYSSSGSTGRTGSAGGSTTHSSSSGATHGGRSGKF